jgi:hypothetical protein
MQFNPMKKIVLPLLLFAQLGQGQSSETHPFVSIGDYPDSYTPETVLVRLIAGLGYRYHWASKDLTPKDLDYRPSLEAASTRETLEHLYGLSTTIANACQNQPNIRPQDFSEMTYKALRAETLNALQQAVAALSVLETTASASNEVVFQRGDKTSSFPFWHLISGPISDALYHVGQLVSFRRTTGNPLNSKVNVFMGKNKK